MPKSKPRKSRSRRLSDVRRLRLFERLENRLLLTLGTVFEIEGDVETTGVGTHDWDEVYSDAISHILPDNSAGTRVIRFVTDPDNSAVDSSFAGGRSKSVNDIDKWNWTNGSVASKSDLSHGFAAAYEGVAENGDVHTFAYVGADRWDNGGSTTIGVWFLQDPIGLGTDGRSAGKFINKTTNEVLKHEVGDVLFVANFSGSAQPGTITSYTWETDAKGGGSLSDPSPLRVTKGIGKTNTGTISVPWSFEDSQGSTSPRVGEFFEVGVDLNELFGSTQAALPEFSSFLITTQSSSSPNSSLQDFILGEISLGRDVAVNMTADAPVAFAGEPDGLGFTVEVSNVGVGELQNVVLVDQYPSGPLPSGANNDILWSIPADGNLSGQFVLNGTVGNQTLTLAPNTNLSFNESISVHIVGTANSADFLSNTARVTAENEDPNFLGNNIATATITIEVLQQPPVANNDAATVDEDTSTPIDVLANDTDADNDSLAVQSVSSASHGTTAIFNNEVVYTPNQNYNGVDTFTYTINDGNGNTDDGTVTVTVNPVNDAPVAVDDAHETDEDTPLTVAAPGVLGNDNDVDGDPLSATVDSGPSNGSLELNADGYFTYTPALNFHGPDSFTYVASDGKGGSATATVAINVLAVNDAPVAVDDAYATDEDTPLTVAAGLGLLDNDSDADGDPLSATVDSGPSNGSLELNADGYFTYTPALNFHGPDSFTYVASDGKGGSATATVAINVLAVNDAPVAVDDAYATDEDTPLTVAAGPGLLDNDSDADGDSLNATVASGPSNGSLMLNADGSFTYTPDANFDGTDGFTYVASDSNGGSATATVAINVLAVNDAPVAVDDAYATDEDTPLTVAAGPGLLDNDSDADGDSLNATVASGPSNGSLTLNAEGSFTYTPDANFDGTDGFTYVASDGNGGSATATVAINVLAVNDAPVAVDDAYATDEDTPLTVAAPGVLGNDNDVDGDPLSAALASGPSNGSLTLNAEGSFTYTPDANFDGTDGFTYVASDSNGGSATATVAINVLAVNDAPVAADDAYTTNEDTPLTVAAPGVLGNDSDADGDSLNATVASGPSNGSLALNADGSFTYTPAPNFDGADGFTYVASDSNGGSATATVAINVLAVNDAPVAADDAYATDEDTPLTVAAPGVLGNDSDADGDSLSAALASGPSNGSLTLNADGSFTYTPDANFDGTDGFTYVASDGNSGSATAVVTLTVNAVNDPPVAVDDSEEVEQNGAVLVDVLANDSDPDGDVLSIQSFSQGGFGSVSIVQGKLLYQPNFGANGSDSFTYVVTDGSATDTAEVTIDVTTVLGGATVLDNANHNVDTDGDGSQDAYQDPSGALYSRGGFTRWNSQQGYLLDVAYSAADAGNTATYDYSPINLADGNYVVSATWSTNSNRATNAPYTISTAGGDTTVAVNQQLEPDDFTSDGGYWEKLAEVTVTGGTLVVSLTDIGADGYVIADAIRINPVVPIVVDVLGEIGVVDDGDDGYTCGPDCTPFTVNPSTSEVVADDGDYFAGDNSGSQAQWSVNVIPTFSYIVGVSWDSNPNRATNAPYAIVSGSNSDSLTVNQQVTAASNQGGTGAGVQVIDGISFQILTGIVADADTITVTVTDDANGFVTADAVFVQRVSPLMAEEGQKLAGDVDFGAAADAGTLAAATEQAVAAWAGVGLDDAQQAILYGFQTSEMAIAGPALGLASPDAGRIFIDTAKVQQGYDLLTVVAHEIGHLLGYEDLYGDEHVDSLMSATLPLGMQRLPLMSAGSFEMWSDTSWQPQEDRLRDRTSETSESRLRSDLSSERPYSGLASRPTEDHATESRRLDLVRRKREAWSDEVDVVFETLDEDGLPRD